MRKNPRRAGRSLVAPVAERVHRRCSCQASLSGKDSAMLKPPTRDREPGAAAALRRRPGARDRRAIGDSHRHDAPVRVFPTATVRGSSQPLDPGGPLRCSLQANAKATGLEPRSVGSSFPARRCPCTTLTRASHAGVSWSSQASTRSVTTLATARAGEQARHGSAFVEQARAAPFWSSRGFVSSRVSGHPGLRRWRSFAGVTQRLIHSCAPLALAVLCLEADPVSRREASTRRRPATLRA